ncbi:Ubiquitin- modifier 1 [Lambiella insularis]|nr:Ubiquitin- modifier 1 [Lambiella insularis]
MADNKSKPSNVDTLCVTVDFTGGLEMLFSNKRRHELVIPAKDENNKQMTMADLIHYLFTTLMNHHRKDMFVVNGSIRPGILILINDADWELEGQDTYELQQKDNILFVSTLHGG